MDAINLARECRKCGQLKPLTTEFFRLSSGGKANSFGRTCRACMNAAKAEYRRTPHGKKVAAEYRAANPDRMKEEKKKWRQRNRDLANQYERLNRKAYPERFSARKVLRYAISQGRVERWPCQVCGDPKSQGHHPDYSRPLDVVWLCIRHHKEAHLAATSHRSNALPLDAAAIRSLAGEVKTPHPEVKDAAP